MAVAAPPAPIKLVAEMLVPLAQERSAAWTADRPEAGEHLGGLDIWTLPGLTAADLAPLPG